MVKLTPFAGSCRSLFCAALLIGAFPAMADAATWQWSSMPGRERLTLHLDQAVQQAQATRNGTQSLRIELAPPPTTLTQEGSAPLPDALIEGVAWNDGELTIRLSSPAFGFVSSRPTPDSLALDIFRDPLGARWQPGGGIAPAGVLPDIPPAAVMAPPAGEARPASVSPPSSPALPDGPVAAEGTPPAPSAAPEGQAETAPPPSPAPEPTPSAQIPSPPSTAPHEADTAAPHAESTAPATPGTAATPPVAANVHAEPTNSVEATPLSPPPSPNGGADLPSAPSPSANVPEVQSAPNAPRTVTGQTLPAALASRTDAALQAPAASEQNPPPLARTDATESAGTPGTAVPQGGTTNLTIVTGPAAASGSVPPADPSSAPAASGSNTTPVIQTPQANPATVQPVSPAAVPQATPPVATPTGGVIRSRLNMAGPEAWPQSGSTPPSQTISSAPHAAAPSQPAGVTGGQPAATPDANATGSPASPPRKEENASPSPAPQDQPSPGSAAEQNAGSAAEAAPPAVQPIYVDEEGNPVPPPPDVPTLMENMRAQISGGRFGEALQTLKILQTAELNREEREEVLYATMTAMYEIYRPDNFEGHAEELMDAANAAMNANLDSPRIPEALSVLADVSLAGGNMADARGYIYLLRRRYPSHPNVPITLIRFGEQQMLRQEYADASLSFQTILQEYPESRSAKNAARLQTYALYRQGHFDRALTLVDFVERRWPRIYLEDPNYLSMAADIQTREGRLDDALRTYWTEYNLTPGEPDSAETLQRIAEIYYRQNKPENAAKVLEELVRAFPDSAEAPLALLRIGENGIHPGNPDVDALFAMFEEPNPRLPGLYYQRILKEYPDSPEALTAGLRSVAWQLWNKEYNPAMNAARSFMIDYENKPESLRARDILLRAFAHELGVAMAEENFERVLTLWERFPQVQDYYQPLEPDLRVALARGQLNRGQEDAGLQLLSPFLDGPEDTDYGYYTYNLYLAAYLRRQDWNGILTLGEQVADWNLPDEARTQLDYAMALSAENLGLPGRAMPLWQKLAPREDIPLYQRAYASYFLARDAERRQDLRGAYQYNLDTLGMFTQLQDEQSPYADQERIRESIAALMDVTEIAGRFAESLEWANQYAAFVPDASPDYAGLRFREARLHRKMGDMTRWRAILEGIVDREPNSVFGQMAASELHTENVARDLTRFTGQ